jgi:hypothetical protein
LHRFKLLRSNFYIEFRSTSNASEDRNSEENDKSFNSSHNPQVQSSFNSCNFHGSVIQSNAASIYVPEQLSRRYSLSNVSSFEKSRASKRRESFSDYGCIDSKPKQFLKQRPEIIKSNILLFDLLGSIDTPITAPEYSIPEITRLREYVLIKQRELEKLDTILTGLKLDGTASEELLNQIVGEDSKLSYEIKIIEERVLEIKNSFEDINNNFEK